MSRRLTAGLAVLALAVPVIPAVPAHARATGAVTPAAAWHNASLPRTNFPLGVPAKAKQSRVTVAPGIDLFTVRHGTPTDGYTVSVLMRGKATTNSLATAEEAAAAVADIGVEPVIQRVVVPAVADYPPQTLYMVRIGSWPLKQRAKAEKVVKQLKQFGISAVVDYLGDDGLDTTGPWDLRILTVDPRRFRGSYQASLGTGTGKRETVSAMGKKLGAIAGVNGGFFSIHAPAAFRGDPTGISVVGGRLLSEAVPGRTALVLRGRQVRVTELKTTITVKSADNASLRVAGVNRVPAADELILYTEELGTKTPADGGTEVVLDASGKVIQVRDAGGPVKKGTRVLHGVGTAADWLWAHAWEGWTLKVTSTVTDLRTGKRLPLTPDTHIIGGTVRLLRNGKEQITAAANGHASLNMILRRHPRTLAGVTKDGRLILVTVDGRRPGETVGASMKEAARLMRWLGAWEAVNLDGGGSTTMVVRGKVVNRPSDGAERPVGDGLFIVP